jgi:predicted GIY-YIG superfamily endonuclease
VRSEWNPEVKDLAWLYILKCSDGSYYTGSTVHLERRIAEHQEGVVKGYTSSRLPVEVVYVCEFPTEHDAFLRERQVKGWSRAKKEALIRSDFEASVELSKSGSAGVSGREAQRDDVSQAHAGDGDP